MLLAFYRGREAMNVTTNLAVVSFNQLVLSDQMAKATHVCLFSKILMSNFLVTIKLRKNPRSIADLSTLSGTN